MAERVDNIPDEYIDNLARHEDLARLIPHPQFGGGILPFLRSLNDIRNLQGSPTFNALTGQRGGEQLLEELVQRGVLLADEADSLKGQLVTPKGLFKAPTWDRLALSRLPTQVIRQLARDGFGTWPVSGETSLDESNLRELSPSLTPEQIALLAKATTDTASRFSVLWFNDEDLIVREGVDINPNFIPSATQLVAAFSSFFRQENYYPTSHGEWFWTGSAIPLSLMRAYRNNFLGISVSEILPYEILKRALVRKYFPTNADEVLPYLYRYLTPSTPARLRNGWYVNRTQDSHAYRVVIKEKPGVVWDLIKEEEKYEYREREGQKYGSFEKDFHLTIFPHARDYGYVGLDAYEGGYSAYLSGSSKPVVDIPIKRLNAEVDDARKRTAKQLEPDILFPLAMAIDQEGLKFAIVASKTAPPASLREHLIWHFGGREITVNCWQDLYPRLEKEVYGLPIIEQAKLPNILTEEAARQRYQKKIR